MCVCVVWVGGQSGEEARRRCGVIDGGGPNGELLRLSSCKVARSDAITLTVDNTPSITFTHKTKHSQMDIPCVFAGLS